MSAESDPARGAPLEIEDLDIEVRRRFVVVDGIRTHYLDAGDGSPLVLLHSGEFGGCAEFSWVHNLTALAAQHRVIAPDWLGFGHTDKLYDFGGNQARRLQHMRRFLEVLAVGPVPFVGTSMGATLLAGVAASGDAWPMTALVLASGGGFVPDNAARRDLMAFDGTADSMRTGLRALFHGPAWADNAAYVRRQVASATAPGAWEAVAAARFRSPLVPPRSQFGGADTIAYEDIPVPVLLIAGADDALRLPGYGEEVVRRIPDGRLLVLDECGHLPQIEQSEQFDAAALEFLSGLSAPR
jgi:pimeloyl-ACP methyl ester carboxylesterase